MKIRFGSKVLPLAACALAIFLEPPPAVAQAPAGDRYIVTFRTGTPRNDRANSASRAGVQLRYNFSLTDTIAITVPNVNALAALQRDITVLSILPDREVTAIQRPGSGGGSGSGQTVPASITRVDPNQYWKTGSDGSGIGVAILDTGVDFNHTDLAPETSIRFSAHDSTCQDGNGHGTHVAGTVAARDNTLDVVGIAPKAKIYCGKVLNNSGSGSDSDIMAGLEWVVTANLLGHNIRVVNMSLGRAGSLNDNPPLRATFAALYNAGVAVVVAAGNDSGSEVQDMIPAGYPEVLAVASTTALAGSNSGCRSYSGIVAADTASYFTTDGKLSATNIGVTISAPGNEKESISKSCFLQSTGILSLKAGGGTTRMSGTSMASPLVAGIVARLMQKNVAQTAAGVESIRTTLRNTAQLVGTAPKNSPTSSYTSDTEYEGVALAPAP